MFGNPKCPKCDKEVAKLDAKQLIIGDQFAGPFWHGISATCPHCKTILGMHTKEGVSHQQLVHEMDELRKSLGLPKAAR